MRMEKERAANEAQRNASTAKVRNLSCKRVPRDSFLTATRNSCNQAQTDPPTRSPNKMLHRKNAFTGVFFLHAQHLATDPFSKHNPTQCSSSDRAQQAKSEKYRTVGFKYPCGRTLQKGQVPLSKGPLPLFVFKVLEDSTNFNPTSIGFPPPRIKNINS